MHVVGRVESAASRCSFDEDDNDPLLADWDAAAALLVGSEATGHTDGSAGHLLFKIIQVSRTDQRVVIFSTVTKYSFTFTTLPWRRSSAGILAPAERGSWLR